MTLFCSHQDRPHRPVGLNRSPIALPSRRMLTKQLRVFARRAMGRIGAGFKILHQAIVTAKTRRIQREQMFDEIPQQPMILGDKWDF
ncbi:MAG: hypothetical protein E7813_05480 [Bradyrhizobium sp.]|uniref:hypothetical protein n=1 Tax=Bradyrhizobium sp. TaxID=376 RepID=UPI0012073E21|nr:hypothetical protein [Bradyrhizobium sp.]THD71464.1 MAG: hypothetical protein E7813_05480 [Bradyrhizobium sp.]